MRRAASSESVSLKSTKVARGRCKVSTKTPKKRRMNKLCMYTKKKWCWLAKQQPNGLWTLSLEVGDRSLPLGILLKNEKDVKMLLAGNIVFVHAE